MSTQEQKVKALNLLSRVVGFPVGSHLAAALLGEIAGRGLVNWYNSLMPGEGLDVNPAFGSGVGIALGATKLGRYI